mmetsp:Transcript_78567/g.123979  ORF Transcript_78567/g.123979 Transcript_78567/m.123979 type:complete len:215 (+) Transcript_78567:42-686(+)
MTWAFLKTLSCWEGPGFHRRIYIFIVGFSGAGGFPFPSPVLWSFWASTSRLGPRSTRSDNSSFEAISWTALSLSTTPFTERTVSPIHILSLGYCLFQSSIKLSSAIFRIVNVFGSVAAPSFFPGRFRIFTSKINFEKTISSFSCSFNCRRISDLSVKSFTEYILSPGQMNSSSCLQYVSKRPPGVTAFTSSESVSSSKPTGWSSSLLRNTSYKI